MKAESPVFLRPPSPEGTLHLPPHTLAVAVVVAPVVPLQSSAFADHPPPLSLRRSVLEVLVAGELVLALMKRSFLKLLLVEFDPSPHQQSLPGGSNVSFSVGDSSPGSIRKSPLRRLRSFLDNLGSA